MAAGEGRLRAALFCVCVLALLLGAIVFSPQGRAPGPQPRPPAVPRRSVPRPAPEATALRRQARRFLAAFVRYEVGDLSRGVRGRLRGTATPGFAASLLRRSPRSPPRAAAARITSLSVAVLPALPSRALISGAAVRNGRSEQFSFLFLRRDGVWLASGPGQ